MTVHYKTESGRFSVRGDYAICTVPFSVLRTIEVAAAVLARQAAGDPPAQLPRLDQDPVPGPATGSGRTTTASSAAATVTDLPIRRMNYPTPDPTTTRGVLLASYTWGQDALQWGAMDEETRLEEALDDVARIHPADPRGVRGRRLARLVRRPLGARRVRDVRAGAADRAPGRHRPAGGPDPLRRRALLALPRLDPGRARVGHPGRPDDPRGSLGLSGGRNRKFVPHAGVDGVGVLDRGRDRPFDPASRRAGRRRRWRTRAVRPAGRCRRRTGWSSRAAGRAARCRPRRGRAPSRARSPNSKCRPCLGMDLAQVLERLGDPLGLGQHAVGHAVLLPGVRRDEHAAVDVRDLAGRACRRRSGWRGR